MQSPSIPTVTYYEYLPAEFMKTATVPIIKCKIGKANYENTYRPIALDTAFSKNIELCLLEIIELYLDTHIYVYLQ